MSDYDPGTEDKLKALIAADPRYPREAYEFISEALAYTGQMLDQAGHVSGQQLCEGTRRLAVERFGYMARTVLESWNVRATDDFGRLVYNMIGADLLRKADDDSIEDFHAIYDFREAFDEAFRIELETNH
jgi:uncharacterized repeat protein (TIGR04138 family)